MPTTALKAKPKTDTIETGLDEAYRKEMSDYLAESLGETMILLMKTQACHWNVVGPLFYAVHSLTEEHYNDMFAATDVIAERIRALGFPAPLSIASAAAKSHLEEETKLRDTGSMVTRLIQDHETISREMREMTAKAAEAEDFVTHDLLNARLAFHEKAIWMLKALIA